MIAKIKNWVKALFSRSYDFYFVYGIVSFVMVMLVALIIGLVGRASRISDAKEAIEKCSYSVSASFKEDISAKVENLNTLSRWFVQVGNPELSFSLNRKQADVLLMENISAESDMKSLYMVWEPNMFDGKDSLYSSAEYHDSTGRYIPAFLKKADGLVEHDCILNYNDNADVNSYYYYKTKKNVFIQEPRIQRESARNILIMPVIYPLHFGTRLLGVIGADYEINNLNQKLNFSEKPEGCQLVIFSSSGKVTVSPDKSLLIGRGVEAVFDDNHDFFYVKFRRGEDFEVENGNDYIMSRVCNLPDVDSHFSICMICDMDVITSKGNTLLMWTLCIGFLVFVLLMLLIYLFRWYYTVQINVLSRKGEDIANVDKEYVRDNRIYVPEFRTLDDTLFKYHKTFVKIRDLNREIELYRYNEELDTLDSDNQFQKSYNSMLETLRKIADSESDRKSKEESENWIAQGVAAINESMRIGSNKVDVLAQNILMTLVRYTEAVFGGLYVHSKEDDGEYLTLNAAVALNQKKAVRIKIQKGVGLVGTCALEKQPIYLEKLPDDYVKVFSGLGKSKPRMLAVLPMLYDGELVAIVEIAFISKLKPHEMEFLQVISSTIASSLVTARINEQTEQLMQQFRTQADTLAHNEKQMSENISKLKEEQQKSMDREVEMKGLIEAINNSILSLEFSPSGVVLSANERFLKTMHYDMAEVQGVNISDLNRNAAKEHTEMLAQVLQGKYYEKEVMRCTKTREERWFLASYTPYYDLEGNIAKIRVFATDITANKQQQAKLDEQNKVNEKLIHKLRMELAAARSELRASSDN
ncbi:MAG: GAF domain-containing protein [Bacteroidales bacterium]|nr:GAF domain-containing protein [Bacteroidales bacterium]